MSLRRIRHVLCTLGGSFLVFFACSSDVSHPLAPQDAATLVDVVIDTLSDATALDVVPVKDAKADDSGATPQPTIATVNCDKSYTPQGQSFTINYGQKDFPGRSKEDLSRATVMFCYPNTDAGNLGALPAGYLCTSTNAWMMDGMIAGNCGGHADSTVTFIVPPPF